MSAATDLLGLGIVETAGLLRSRSVSVQELVQHHLDAIAVDDQDVHAFVHVDVAGALAAARRADDELAEGRPRSLLHGIPFGVKDTLCVAGMPLEAGSRALKGRVSTFDAWVVRRLRDRGAIPLGKQSTQEFACGQVDPPTVNARDRRYEAGGSSVGSAVSVARGTSMFAIGSDSVGSVRMPASANGVTGMIPTAHAVSRHGMIPCSDTLDRIGWLTRSVDDAAAVADAVMVGRGPFGHRGSSDLAGVRIGFDESMHANWLDDAVARSFGRTVQRLATAGATMVPLDLQWLDQALPAANLIFTSEAASVHRGLLERSGPDYGDRTRQFLTAGALVPSHAIEAARFARQSLTARLDALHEAQQLTLLVAPTVPTAPQLRQDHGSNPLATSHNVFNAWANITDRPAISVPALVSDAALPIGTQFVGRRGDDRRLLRVAVVAEALIGQTASDTYVTP